MACQEQTHKVIAKYVTNVSKKFYNIGPRSKNVKMLSSFRYHAFWAKTIWPKDICGLCYEHVTIVIYDCKIPVGQMSVGLM